MSGGKKKIYLKLIVVYKLLINIFWYHQCKVLQCSLMSGAYEEHQGQYSQSMYEC